MQKYEKYLGLPTLVGKSRSKAFKNIKDRVWDRLQSWKVNFLSQAGKEVLLKAVIQAIPTYCMLVFLLPIALCKEINKLMQRFWWGHKENNSKIHWMCWEKMRVSKARGGLGFRDLVLFNKAFLAKQIWRLYKNPESLVAIIFQAKYYSSSTVLEAQVRKRPSLAWRSLLLAKGIIKKGTIWRVGMGKISACGVTVGSQHQPLIRSNLLRLLWLQSLKYVILLTGTWVDGIMRLFLLISLKTR